MSHTINESRFYVYILLDTRKDVVTPFYVGKGSGFRKTAHFRESSLNWSKNPVKNAVIRKIRAVGLKPDVFVIADGLTENEAFALERKLISRFGRRDLKTGILTNLTDGGEGSSGVSQETRDKMKLRMTGAGSPTYGVGHTDASRALMSEKAKERLAKSGPSKHSEEWKQKLREDNPGSRSLQTETVKIDRNGGVIARYPSVKHAFVENEVSPSYMNKLVKPGATAFKGYLYRKGDYVVSVDELSSCFEPLPPPNKVSIVRLSQDGTSTKYVSMKEVIYMHPELIYHRLWKAVKAGTVYEGCYWSRQ